MFKVFKWPFTLFIILVCLSLIVLCYAFVDHYQPYEHAAANFNANADQAQTIGDQKPQAQKRVDNAKQMVIAENDTWAAIVEQHSPSTSVNTGGINIGENSFQLVHDAPEFRNSIQRAVNRQIKSGGVKVLVGPYVTDPPQESDQILASYFNYPAIPFPVVIFNLGQVQVQGTWDQIMRNFKSWASMPSYFAVADGLRIDGTSPYLTGTYNVTIVGYIKGKSVFPTIPSGSVGGSSGSGAGGRGGPASLGRPGGGPGGGPAGGGGPGMPGMPSRA